ncbi:helix-turn-helix transcriptional regulator [Ralstonia soli]|nr:helix-turn-helix transcriptional regulator [Ralstonia soli]
MLMEATHTDGRSVRAQSTPLSLTEFGTLLGSIYQGAMDPVPWARALELIRTYLCANYVSLILRPPGADRLSLAVHASPEGYSTLEGDAIYNSYYYALDPFVGLPTDRLITVDEHIGVNQWCNSDFYQQFAKPSDVRFILGADITTDDGAECRLRICRGHDGPDFSAEDKLFCSMIVPHLRRAVDLHSRMDVVETERTLYASAIDRMLVGMAILDQNGAIIRTNSAADEILAEKDGISLVKGALEVNYAQENRRFQRVLREAVSGYCSSALPVVEAMSITRPSGKARFGVLIRSIPLGEWSEDSKSRPACVIFIRDPERKSQASQEVVRKLFDFTPAETQLALQLADGLTLEEAADELCIAKNTARAHLRAIFAKTGVTRQATLVRMLLSSVVSLG